MNTVRLVQGITCGWAVLVLGVLTGCGGSSDPNIGHVAGTVTFDGKPLPAGMIVFEPDPARGNHGQQGYADIADGKFDTRKAGKGVSAGAQIARITGGDGTDSGSFTPFGNLLFEEHTVRIDVSQNQTPLQLDVPKPNVNPKSRTAR